MGRFSPTVLARPDEDLGQSISEAVALFLDENQRRHQMGLADEESARRDRLTDVQLYGQGWRPGAPPLTPEDIADKLEKGANPAQSAVPGVAPGEASSMAADQLEQMQSGVSATIAPSRVQALGQRFYRMGGGYLDTENTPEARQRRMRGEEWQHQEGYRKQGWEREDQQGAARAQSESAIDTREEGQFRARAQFEDALRGKRGAQEQAWALQRIREEARLRAENKQDTGPDPRIKEAELQGAQVDDARATATALEKQYADPFSGELPDSLPPDLLQARGRLDSLESARGETVGALGGIPEAAAAYLERRTPVQAGSDMGGFQAALKKAQLQRQQALNAGIPREKVEAAYQQTVAQLTSRFQLPQQ